MCLWSQIAKMKTKQRKKHQWIDYATQVKTISVIPILATAVVARTIWSRRLFVIKQLHGPSDFLFYVIKTKNNGKNARFWWNFVAPTRKSDCNQGFNLRCTPLDMKALSLVWPFIQIIWLIWKFVLKIWYPSQYLTLFVCGYRAMA